MSDAVWWWRCLERETVHWRSRACSTQQMACRNPHAAKAPKTTAVQRVPSYSKQITPNNDVHEILQEAIARCISRRSPSCSPRSKAGRQAGEERKAHSGRKACCCSAGLRTHSSETGVCSHSCNAQNSKTRRPEAHQSRRCGQEEGICSKRQAQTGSSFRRQSLIHHQEAAAR